MPSVPAASAGDIERIQLPPILGVAPQAWEESRNTEDRNLRSGKDGAADKGEQQVKGERPALLPYHWPSLNPLTAYYTPGHVQAAEPPLRMDIDASSATGTLSPDGRASSVSLDDPDVRLAAEALGDLRADFVSSPTLSATSRTPQLNKRAEPILSLLTTSHPLLARTIEGTTSAYVSSKNFSPKFKTGAEYVEGYLTPLGNTLGSVGRVTGVEGGVRWFLGAGRRQRSAVTNARGDSDNSTYYKRRRLGSQSASARASPPPIFPSHAQKQRHAGTDAENFDFSDRRLSMSTVDTLPAYEEQASPAYTETAGHAKEGPSSHTETDVRGSAPWQSRLIMSTSGLSIAMSDESLRSLKYCLHWLRWANDHTGQIAGALKSALEQFEANAAGAATTASNSATATTTSDAASDATVDVTNTPASDVTPGGTAAKRTELAARIAALRGDVLGTLRGVIDTVSKYAGGALPENARVLVRRHLTSLPQRFRLASQFDGMASPTAPGLATDAEICEGAQRVLVLAMEGLDMMTQVSGVLDGTIVSAEEWCERLGKKTAAQMNTADRSRLDLVPTAPGDLLAPALPVRPAPSNGREDVVMQ